MVIEWGWLPESPVFPSFRLQLDKELCISDIFFTYVSRVTFHVFSMSPCLLCDQFWGLLPFESKHVPPSLMFCMLGLQLMCSSEPIGDGTSWQK